VLLLKVERLDRTEDGSSCAETRPLEGNSVVHEMTVKG